MKKVTIFLGIFLSLLLLVNFCYGAEQKVAELQPGHGADAAKNGEEVQEEKFKFFHHDKPFFKKHFFKPIPKPFVKKPIPHFPFLKKPFPKPYYPPLFPKHP